MGSKCIKKINLKKISLHFPFTKFVALDTYILRLIIDQGNTNIKIALFEGQELIKKEIVNRWESVFSYVDNVESIILSSVKKNDIPDVLQRHSNFLLLNHRIKIPIINKCTTPHTLGMDRLAAVIGAWARFPKTNTLVIDSGTCITFDIITKKRDYLGGSIAPGLHMRFKSLNQQTSKLPLLNPKNEIPDLVGNSTEKSIQSGVINGMICEIDGVIDRYKSEYSDLKILLTGGDSNFFDKELKNSIFAAPNLVLEGLNVLLQHNETNF